MGRKTLAAKNSIIGLASQVITTLLKFLLRSIFIQYLGVELLGINSTLVSVLNTLSLAELGFHTAVVFRLYAPLKENDEDRINSIVTIFSIVYKAIGIFFIVAGIVCIPLLKFIIKGIDVTFEVYVYFLLLVANSATSYFLAYKRTILYADKKDYYSKIIDSVTNIVFTILKIAIIILFRNYVLYLLINILQTVVSNLIVHFYCSKLYPYLEKVKFSKDTFKIIMNDVKNVFASKIAGFVYTSTDNLLISMFIGTVQVGYFVNYTTITTSLKTIINSALNPITPIIGNMLTDKDNKKSENVLFQYTFIRYLLAVMILVPFIVVVQDFISFWVNDEFLLDISIVILLSIDLYIFLIHNVFLDYINGSGLFKEEKYIEIGSALINIAVSIALVFNFGIAGILIGTVITQIYCWITRSLLTYKKCFESTKKMYLHYWMKNLIYIMVISLQCIVLYFIHNALLAGLSPLLRFIFGAVISEIFVIASTFIIFYRTKEEKAILSYVKKVFKK